MVRRFRATYAQAAWRSQRSLCHRQLLPVILKSGVGVAVDEDKNREQGDGGDQARAPIRPVEEGDRQCAERDERREDPEDRDAVVVQNLVGADDLGSDKAGGVPAEGRRDSGEPGLRWEEQAHAEDQQQPARHQHRHREGPCQVGRGKLPEGQTCQPEGQSEGHERNGGEHFEPCPVGSGFHDVHGVTFRLNG